MGIFRDALKTDEARQVTVRESSGFRYDPSDFSDFSEPHTSPSRPTSGISLPSNGHLDLCTLRVSPRIKYLMQHGDTIGQYPCQRRPFVSPRTVLLQAIDME